jgi:hypothetical protein
MAPHPRIDTAALLERVDLVELIDHHTELRKVSNTAGGEWAGPCVFCGGHDRLRVQQRRWWCRQCSPSERWQDAIVYVQLRDDSDFLAACKSLGAQATATSAPRAPSATQSRHEPPSAAWQEEAGSLVDWAAIALLGDERLMRGLRERRGLEDKTVEASGLGWWSKDGYHDLDDDHRHTWLGRGLLIPWRDGQGGLSAVKVRRPNNTEPKYTSWPGSVISTLYGTVRPGRPLVLVESELDVLLLLQVFGGQVGVATPGNARPRLSSAAIVELLSTWSVLVAYDNDAAGQEAAVRLVERLRPRFRLAPPPAGHKSLADAVLAGYDAQRWLAELDGSARVTPPPAAYPEPEPSPLPERALENAEASTPFRPPVVRWSRTFGFLEIRDVFDGRWHQVAREDAPKEWVRQAMAALGKDMSTWQSRFDINRPAPVPKGAEYQDRCQVHNRRLTRGEFVTSTCHWCHSELAPPDQGKRKHKKGAD